MAHEGHWTFYVWIGEQRGRLIILAEIIMRGDAFVGLRQHHRLILRFLVAM